MKDAFWGQIFGLLSAGGADRRSDPRMHLSWSNSIIFIILFLISTDMYL